MATHQKTLSLFVKSDDFLLGSIHMYQCVSSIPHQDMSYPHCWTSVDITNTGWTLVHRPTLEYRRKGSLLKLMMLTQQEYDALRTEVYTEHEIAFITKVKHDLNEHIRNNGPALPEGHWDRALEIIASHEVAMLAEFKLMVKAGKDLLALNIAHLREQL